MYLLEAAGSRDIYRSPNMMLKGEHFIFRLISAIQSLRSESQCLSVSNHAHCLIQIGIAARAGICSGIILNASCSITICSSILLFHIVTARSSFAARNEDRGFVGLS